VHGVFPSSCKQPASSRVFQFHWVDVGDSGEVVTPFMQVGTYPTRNFATFGPSELQPPFTETYKKCQNIFCLTLQHRAGVSLYTSFYKFAETCVFIKQSLPPILWQLNQVALVKLFLLPKLRNHFAEFLQHHSLIGLGLLNLSTRVGFGYGFKKFKKLFPEFFQWLYFKSTKIKSFFKIVIF